VVAFAQAQDTMSRIGHFILFAFAFAIYKLITHEWVPKIEVEQTKEEKAGVPGKRWKPGTPFPKDMIPCYDPGTLDMLGPDMPADNAEHVRIKIERARIAQKKWAKSSFKQRRLLIKTINRFVLENQDTICKVSARDSGKPLVDAAFGEVIVTLEKCKWLLKEGERWLRPEKRSSGLMMFYKNARVEYHPVGVMGAIVPWNYPFHNVFNPLLANVFAGNALVVKVSEYASWSSLYYGRAIKECLRACGAPEDLVQIVHGYGEAVSLF
jgi:acyl-CoA reductase-like NAD-dependent aldehyde dehydrogenase